MSNDNEKLKKLKILATLGTDSNLLLYETINNKAEETQTKVDELKSYIDDKFVELKNTVDSIEMPEQKDHTAHMEKMMQMLEEPQEVTVTLNII